jgi:hypothetical protein
VSLNLGLIKLVAATKGWQELIEERCGASVEICNEPDRRVAVKPKGRWQFCPQMRRENSKEISSSFASLLLVNKIASSLNQS